MIDEREARKQAVDAVIRGVAKKTMLVTALAAAFVLVYVLFASGDRRWWLLPASVLFGSALGLVNFRWLAVAVQRVYLRPAATPVTSNIAAVIISVLKLSLIFVVLFVVIKGQLLNIFGLVAGLSLCFIAILWEGATMMRKALIQTGPDTDKHAFENKGTHI